MSIEQTLASMAHRQLTQNMPSLAPNLLGFEIITNSDDNTFALGVNVALIGDTYVFIPTILKNGRIAPVDLMYVPELDQFLPCKDAWITYLNSKKTDLIATISKKRKTGNAGNVDLDMPFTSITKVASADFSIIQDYAKEVMVDALCSAPNSTGIPCVSELIDIAPINGLKKLASYIESTDGHNSMIEFYSDNELKEISNKLNTRLGEEINRPLIGSTGEVKILTSASSEARTLSNDDKVKILRDGAVIKDSRGLVPSKVYKTKTNSEWCTPNETGIYELLKVDGTTLTALVVNAQVTEGKPHKHTEQKNYYVIPLDDGQARKAYQLNNRAIVGQPYADTSHVVIKGSNVTALAQETTSEVLLLNDKGSVKTIQLSSRPGMPSIRKDDEIIITRKINSGIYASETARPNIGTSTRAQGLDGIIIGKEGSKIRIANNYLRVGKDTTYFPVVPTYFSEEIPRAIQLLATVDNIVDAISRRQGNISVDIFSADDLVYIDSDIVKVAGASPINAAFMLVDKLAISPNDADLMIKTASAEHNVRHGYIVKIAADTQFGMMHATDRPTEEFEVDSQVLQPMQHMSDEDRNILQKATESGTKEIFDVSILRILAEEDSPAQIINEWMPSLFTALDKVGRILYLCRAGESMQEAYGIDRVEDVERKLRKQFNELGDIILTMLKGKVKDIDDLLNGEL